MGEGVQATEKNTHHEPRCPDEVAVDGAVVDGRRSFHEVADDGRDVLRYFDDDDGRVASRRGCRSCRNT